MVLTNGTKLAPRTRGMVKLMACCLGLWGCLLPPGVEEISAPDNEPPVIDQVNLSPPPSEGVQFYSIRCLSYPFFGALRDGNAADTLYWRVFIDYALDPRPQTTEILVSAPQPDASARLFEFNIDPLDERFRGVGPHTVELFVSDRPFFTNEREPKGRAVQDEALVDTHTWAVQLVDVDDASCTQPR